MTWRVSARAARTAPRGRDARDRERAERAAVVGAVARDHDPPSALAARAEMLACELPGRLDRFRAARGEEHARHLRRGEREHPLRQRQRGRVRGGPVRVVGQALHLRRCGGPDLGAVRVADLRREEPGHGVQQTRSVGLDHIRAVAPDEHRRSLALDVGHLRPRQPLCRAALSMEGSQRTFDLAHARPFGLTRRRDGLSYDFSPLRVSTPPHRVATGVGVSCRRECPSGGSE